MKALLSVLCLLSLPAIAWSDDNLPAEQIRTRIERGLRIVEKAAGNYPTNRDCFSCHHQTLPMLAIVEAREYGIVPEAKLLQDQADYTHGFFAGRADSVREGKSVGGRGMTAAYALWALDLADRKRDEISGALVLYLVKTQQKNGQWKVQTKRPPLEESNIFTTFLAAYYMEKFAPDDAEDVAVAVEKAQKWIAESKPNSQEDLNAKLWALDSFGGEATKIGDLQKAIFIAQREDGGWSQLKEMESDAYATGQTLFVLHASGLDRSHPGVQRGLDFLLKTQQPDGSWFVKTRSKPIQKFFDNGDPHGKNQFISISATSWAVATLAALQATAPSP